MPAAPQAEFSGLWIPLVTPFRRGQVDHRGLAALTCSLSSTGIQGFVVCGSTGEAASLDDEEQLKCLSTVAAHTTLPLVMGVGGHHLGRLLERVRLLSDVARGEVPGLRAVLVAAPYYVRPSQSGVRRWFEAVADASELPLILYDIPYRTGIPLSRDTLLALAAHPNIVAVKDCGGDPGKTLALIHDGRLNVLAGEDLQMFSLLAQGGAGAIAASAHLRTRDFVAMVHALTASRLEQARALWIRLAPMIEALFAEPNPAPLKSCLSRSLGVSDELREPMMQIQPELRKRLDWTLEEIAGDR